MTAAGAWRLGRVLTIASAVVMALFVARAATGAGGAALAGLAQDLLYPLSSLLACLAVALRALRPGPSRAGWVFLSVALIAGVTGNVVAEVISVPGRPLPLPSLADAVWVLVPVFGGLGLALLIRRDRARPRPGSGPEAALAVATVAAISAAVVVEPVTSLLQDADVARTVAVLMYPVLDAAMVGTAVALLVRRSWRLSPSVGLLLASLTCLMVTDGVVLVLNTRGGYVPGGLLDAGWLLAGLGVAVAGLLDETTRARRASPWMEHVLPLMLTAVALGILTLEALADANQLTIVVAALALTAGLARMAAATRENRILIASTRVEAYTDPLTGLANRRQLLTDLEAWDGEPLAISVFDLDGFKTYNDTYGHGAGDALLRQIADALTRAVGDAGRAYRMGGDEFSALLPIHTDVERVAQALVQSGEGFRVTTSHGTAHLPNDATEPDDALRIADARMYACKFRVRASAARQSADVLLAALQERNGDLARHGADVAELAADVARAMGVDDEDGDHIRQAARLHDIGKLAIPESILNKQGSLTRDEWAFMHQHTIIGERILHAAPALSRAACVVRSTHERWDGTGYPDGLCGESIPLGSRIVFACDALDAMTQDRVYRLAMPLEDALDELLDSAGSQFDPAVVNTLIGLIRAGYPLGPMMSAAAASPERTAPSM